MLRIPSSAVRTAGVSGRLRHVQAVRHVSALRRHPLKKIQSTGGDRLLLKPS
jgi:hypothetical protein